MTLLPEYRLTLFKATTYYGTALFTEALTKLNRRSFFRIRHVTNLLVYQNLLINWAREYLWLRKITRTLFAARLYKYNYLVNLSTTAFNPLEKTFIKLYSYSLAGFSKFFTHFSQKLNPHFFSLFRSTPHFKVMMLSSAEACLGVGKRGKPSNEFVYMTDGAILLPPHSLTPPANTLWSHILLQLQLIHLTELYKVFILVTLYHTLSHYFVFT